MSYTRVLSSPCGLQGVSGSQPLKPDAHVRIVSSMSAPADQLLPGELGLLAAADGALFTFDVQHAFEPFGTTLYLVAADAWKQSSPHYKQALLTALLARPKSKQALFHILRRCTNDKMEFVGAAADGSSGNDQSASSVGDGRSTSQFGAVQVDKMLDRAPFDLIASSYLEFRLHASRFGCAAAKAVDIIKSLDAVFRDTFETVLPGEWQQPSNEWQDESTQQAHMEDTQMVSLLHECRAALQLRWDRNHDAAHPLDTSNPERLAALLAAYAESIDLEMPTVKGFLHLARASLSHVLPPAVPQATQAAPDSGYEWDAD